MKVRTRAQQLKWRLQPRRGRNPRMDALLRNITGSPGYSALAVLRTFEGISDPKNEHLFPRAALAGALKKVRQQG